MIIRTLIVAAAFATSGLAGAGSVQNETHKLLPSDGDWADFFGNAVAVSGNIAIVGSNNDDDNGSGSGSAYLFNVTTGRQIAKLLPVDGIEGAQFGYSVSMYGTLAIVGARLDDDNGPGSGSAYVFDVTTGRQIAKLLPADGDEGDSFGTAVAISNSTAIVGAPFDDDNGSLSGSAYLFDLKSGKQIAKLLPADGAETALFGNSVAISGSTAVVGAPLDDGNGTHSGAAYLFDATTGRQIERLCPNDAAASDFLGGSVGISGSLVIVGAGGADGDVVESGTAYLFDANTGKQIGKLYPEDSMTLHGFGIAVAISGSTAIVGAFYDNDNGDKAGAAYLFDVTTGQQIAKLLPSDGEEGDEFGDVVAIDGDTAIVGAKRNDDNGVFSGSAYIFEIDADVPCDPPADFNCDGVVNATDLFLLLDNWGTCPRGEICAGDLNDDGTVNVADLLLLLNDWG